MEENGAMVVELRPFNACVRTIVAFARNHYGRFRLVKKIPLEGRRAVGLVIGCTGRRVARRLPSVAVIQHTYQ